MAWGRSAPDDHAAAGPHGDGVRPAAQRRLRQRGPGAGGRGVGLAVRGRGARGGQPAPDQHLAAGPHRAEPGARVCHLGQPPPVVGSRVVGQGAGREPGCRAAAGPAADDDQFRAVPHRGGARPAERHRRYGPPGAGGRVVGRAVAEGPRAAAAPAGDDQFLTGPGADGAAPRLQRRGREQLPGVSGRVVCLALAGDAAAAGAAPDDGLVAGPGHDGRLVGQDRAGDPMPGAGGRVVRAVGQPHDQHPRAGPDRHVGRLDGAGLGAGGQPGPPVRRRTVADRHARVVTVNDQLAAGPHAGPDQRQLRDRRSGQQPPPAREHRARGPRGGCGGGAACRPGRAGRLAGSGQRAAASAGQGQGRGDGQRDAGARPGGRVLLPAHRWLPPRRGAARRRKRAQFTIGLSAGPGQCRSSRQRPTFGPGRACATRARQNASGQPEGCRGLTPQCRLEGHSVRGADVAGEHAAVAGGADP